MSKKKITDKHVFINAEKNSVFKFLINEQKVKILINNDSEIEFIDKFYAHKNKLNIFKLKQKVQLILKDGTTKKKFNETALVHIDFENHAENFFCYLANLKKYTIILGNDWLKTHNSLIN